MWLPVFIFVGVFATERRRFRDLPGGSSSGPFATERLRFRDLPGGSSSGCLRPRDVGSGTSPAGHSVLRSSTTGDVRTVVVSFFCTRVGVWYGPFQSSPGASGGSTPRRLFGTGRGDLTTTFSGFVWRGDTTSLVRPSDSKVSVVTERRQLSWCILWT